MTRSLARLSVLAFAATISTGELVGGTHFSRGRWSVDLGVVVPIYDSGTGQPFPVLTIAWAF